MFGAGASSPWVRAFLAMLFASGLAGCDLFPEVKEETAGWSAEKLYQEAHTMMVTGNYTRAVKLFDTLEGRFPYGRYAQQAILEGAYANYRAGETATAVAACDRFIRTYPNHPNVDYAYYLKGVVNFREDQGVFGYVVEQDLSERDPKTTRESFNAFKELITRFPESKYAADSAQRRGAYVAAVNRAQQSLTNYPQTPANEAALITLVRSYDKLGLPQLRDDAERILKSTYPNATLASTKPWWKFWQSDDVFLLLEHDTVPKSKADYGISPP